MLIEEKQVYEDALRAKDTTIAQLKGFIENAAKKADATLSHLGIPQSEEIKEGSEDKLVRVFDHIWALAHEGSLAFV